MSEMDEGSREQEAGSREQEAEANPEAAANPEAEANPDAESPAPDTQPPTPDTQPPIPDIDREVRRLSRRGFFVFGVGALAAYGSWRWLRGTSRIGDVPWPLRRTLEANEKISEAYFRPRR